MSWCCCWLGRTAAGGEVTAARWFRDDDVGEGVEGSGGWWSLKVVAVVLAAAGVAVEGDG
ncbi:hypothetical protein Tco_0651394, partial [Tanacetum coccineum]